MLYNHMSCTFLALLENRGRRSGHLHRQSVRPSEGMAVPHNEAARLLVLQDRDGCMEGESICEPPSQIDGEHSYTGTRSLP